MINVGGIYRRHYKCAVTRPQTTTVIPYISFGHRPPKHEVAYKSKISSKDYKKRFKARHASMWEMAKTYVGYHSTARDAYLIFSPKDGILAYLCLYPATQLVVPRLIDYIQH